MLSQALATHLGRVAQLYSGIVPGSTVSPREERPAPEAALQDEMSAGLQAIRTAATQLSWPRALSVRTGMQKGSWAHVYFVSLHDPEISTGPTKGFYPVFLLSVDQQVCWLTLILAAASVGISGRGGWSGGRGASLRGRAAFLREHLGSVPGWLPGPIRLGPAETSVHTAPGSDRAAARAYECGAIIARSFDPQAPPTHLEGWITEALWVPEIPGRGFRKFWAAPRR